MGGKQHWMLVVDDYADYFWSYFLKEKNELKVHVVELIKEWDSKDHCKVTSICCDNAGKTSHWKGLANREGCECFLNTQHLELLSKME